MKYQNQNQNQNNRWFRVNDQIKFSPVRVIGEDGNALGIMSVDEAKRRARDSDLDLVEVSAQSRPPVCRIMDYSKFKYEQSIKEKKQSQQNKSVQPKELQLSPVMADHDIEIKANAARKFLESGHRVQLRLVFKKRHQIHKDLGFKVLEKISASLSDVGNSTQKAKLDGNTLSCMLEPKRK